MILDDFRRSLTATEPPAGLTHALAGLWWDAKGDWKRAHESAQQDEGPEGSWVHAYLHRKEGDDGNAAIGIVGQASPFAESHWMRNGSAS
jgi:hypothetical protein